MAHASAIRVGIIGAGWPGVAHARGYAEAGGFKLVAVADLIAERRKKLMTDFGIAREFTEAKDLVKDKGIDAVSICLPPALHAPMALAAMRAGKHVVCETPPALNPKQARQIESAAKKSGKTLLYCAQRRFGGAEQASKQAISKGYAGEVFHARASWMRTRGVPIGTGWFTSKAQSGGGALIDIGIHVLDLAWHLLGQPRPLSVYGATHQRFASAQTKDVAVDVEDSAFALIRFENGKTLELSTSWAFNQPPQQQGTLCRVYGDKAAIDVYTPNGAVIHRDFDAKGQTKMTLLPPPRVTGHASLMRHFKECIHGKVSPMVGPGEGVMLMQMIDAIYRSAQTGKSVAM